MISNANKKYGGKTKVIIVILFNYQIITSISKQQLSWLAGLPPKALVAGSITDMALRCSFFGISEEGSLVGRCRKRGARLSAAGRRLWSLSHAKP